ncbi:uncharacterized protein LOC124531067 [Vanessa cardui]|uniref:uncharacterized protein LOC124531067 n=1 Tax=Vanessa cardui TaxID=171605 RepID=UPI001F135A70|nr:uncharacterized protein LOC124531067 [Vanessa cardui]
MKKCVCALARDCECRGHILRPAELIPFEIRYTWNPMFYLRALVCFLLCRPQEPEKNFAQRLARAVYIEELTYKKLKEMDALESRGPEFCLNRCYKHYIPEIEFDNLYVTMKREIRNAIKNIEEESEMAKTDEEIESPPEEEEGESDGAGDEDLEGSKTDKIDTLQEDDDNNGLTETIVDGYYRTVATQGTTDENGEFIITNISHILFGSIDVYNICDIDGKEVNVRHYEETETEEDLPITSKLEDLFSLKGLKGIKNRISTFTNNLYSSIIEIKDTGIPVRSQATQDPPLDDNYQSIIEISPNENYDSDEAHAESCLCCQYYKKYSQAFEEVGDENESQIINTSEENVSVSKDEKLIEDIKGRMFDDPSTLLPPTDNPQYNSGLTTLSDSVPAEIIESNLPRLPQVTENKNEAEMLKCRDEKKKECCKTSCSRNQVKLNSVSKINGKNIIEEDAVISQNIEPEMKPTSDLSNTENTTDKKKRSNVSLRKPFSVNQDDPCKKHANFSSKIDVRILVDKKTQMISKFTQKPSVKRFVNENSQIVSSRRRVRNAFSYENIKLHVKKSFRNTSSAFSTFFKCVNFTSAFNIRRSKDNYVEKEDKPAYTDAGNNAVKELDSSDRRNFEISEEEMFSLQYTSDLMNKANSTDAKTN